MKYLFVWKAKDDIFRILQILWPLSALYFCPVKVYIALLLEASQLVALTSIEVYTVYRV